MDRAGRNGQTGASRVRKTFTRDSHPPEDGSCSLLRPRRVYSAPPSFFSPSFDATPDRRRGNAPSGVVIINLKDEQAFAQALVKLAASKHHATTEREYKGVAIRRVEGENGHALEYAIVGGNFVASGKGAAVERVIDTAQGGRNLKSSAGYIAASAQASGQPQFV